ncbi:hypothetical protein SAY86_009377 [Trapa natans]|uniref:EF-hand domain-containing protein n=1 Tax=Trapa natans TaxID=22666 RepID=A0AAN7L4R7_TRANT|nr:hypothetical protein SAY86_009377 [Trapa natans]
MSPLSVKDLRRVFDNLDKNGDGLLSLEELNGLLGMIGHTQSHEELEASVGKSSLDFDEFLLFYSSISGGGCGSEASSVEDVHLHEAFKVFDLNGDGYITSDELQSVLSRLGMWEDSSCSDCVRMIRAYDTNMDGHLDFEEFKNMMMLTIS